MADLPNPYESPQQPRAEATLAEQDEGEIATTAAVEAYRALPWLMILMLVSGLAAAAILLPGLAVLLFSPSLTRKGQSLFVILTSLLPAALVFLVGRVRRGILALKNDANVSSLTRLMRRSGEQLSVVFVLLSIAAVIQVYMWIAALLRASA